MKILPTLTLATLLISPVWATSGTGDEHASHHPPSTTSAAENDLTEGVVRKIDKEQARVTLRHGELKTLGMPPMTMVFRVADPALLDTLSVGQAIRFRAEKIDGAYTVTLVTPVVGETATGDTTTDTTGDTTEETSDTAP